MILVARMTLRDLLIATKTGGMSWEGSGVGGAGGHLWLRAIESGSSKKQQQVCITSKLSLWLKLINF